MLINPSNQLAASVYGFIQSVTAEVQERWGEKIPLPNFEWQVDEVRPVIFNICLRLFPHPGRDDVSNETWFKVSLEGGAVQIEYYGRETMHAEVITFALEHLRKRN